MPFLIWMPPPALPFDGVGVGVGVSRTAAA
jgi:hypothetical protein